MGGNVGEVAQQCGSNKVCTEKINNWSDLAGDEGGGWGKCGGAGPGRAGKGGDGGGHQRAVWEQQRVDWFFFLGSRKNLTTGLIWLVTR